MTPIREILLSRIKQIIDQWPVEDQYAISFFVYTNEAYEYGDYSNVPYFAISYNTDSQCDTDDPYGEERWNYAFWRQDETPIIDPDEEPEMTALLFDWYKENGITDIGKEDADCYDSNFNYIGKGPVGHYELLQIIAEVAIKLQSEGYVEQHIGKDIPIIIHGLEYAWYDIEATKKANPHGEADTFIKAMKELGMIP